MEIIKRGILPKEKPWFGRCMTCQSEIKAKTEELHVSREKCWDWQDNEYMADIGYGDCPVCNARMRFVQN